MYSTEARRHISAPRPAVFRALLDPEAIARWRVPDGMTAEVHDLDPREGGRFRVSLRYAGDGVGKSSARTDTYQGRFLRLVPDEVVTEAIEFDTPSPELQGTMTITTSLHDHADGTLVVMVQEAVPDAVSPEDNKAGMEMALGNLARLVEGG